MTRPGTVVSLRDTPSVVSQPTDTGVAFIAGLSDRGPLTAQPISSSQDFITTFGDFVSYSSLYDAVEVFFREGGYKAYIGRVVGPGASSGTLNLLDGAAGISLVATAIGPGDWSANYKVAVVAGVGAGTFVIRVTDLAGNILEDSGDLVDTTAAVQWSQFSKYIRLTQGASVNDPAVLAATVLSTGSDDRASITDTEWLNALNSFSSDLGPGQVLAPGRTSASGQGQLITHAESHNRVAIIDLPNTKTVATLQAATAALAKSRFSATFAPWDIIPGIGGSAAQRTVPPSARIAGNIARNDNSLGPNRPAAGNAGNAKYVIDLSQTAWTDAERETLNNSGVNVTRRMFNGIRTYGWRSLANPVTDLDWLDFGNGRLFMAISAELDLVAENFAFDEIDGQFGETIGSFHTALAGVLLEHYNKRELFGDTADQAFSVDTGPGVNTLARIANNELHAVCAVKMAKMAEWISIEVVKTQITQSV